MAHHWNVPLNWNCVLDWVESIHIDKQTNHWQGTPELEFGIGLVQLHTHRKTSRARGHHYQGTLDLAYYIQIEN